MIRQKTEVRLPCDQTVDRAVVIVRHTSDHPVIRQKIEERSRCDHRRFRATKQLSTKRLDINTPESKAISSLHLICQ